MYKQTCSKKPSPLFSAILTLCILLLLTMVSLLCAYLTTVHGISNLSYAALLIFVLAGYFVFRPAFADYVYTLNGDTLTIEQVISRRTVKVYKFKRNKIKFTKGQNGKKLMPKNNKGISFNYEDKTYSFSPDETLLEALKAQSQTDSFIIQSKDDILSTLKKLVSIPSVKGEATNDAPFGQECARVLKTTLELCESLGMKTKNLDNYCGWAEIGNGEKILGILCHLDVVPAADGWNTDPFTLTEKDGKLIGRGAEDDKGPAVAAIYAVAAVKEAVKDLPCRIRIIFGCDEESGWGCMDYYLKHDEIPDMAFTPDAEYPVIITEKGIAHFELSTNLLSGEYQLYIQSGLRPNMVPTKAMATVIGDISRLEPALKEYPLDLSRISYQIQGNTLTINSVGVGAHGSTPELGVNAMFEMFKLLNALNLCGDQGEFVKKFIDLFVDKTDGSGANLKLSDEISGNLTLNVGMCYIGKNDVYANMTDDACKIVIDVRYPVSCNLTDIALRLQQAIPDTWESSVEHHQAPHHVDTSSPLVTTLMEVYNKYTGKNDTPIAIGGGTYARAFPKKAVAFGVNFPGKPGTAHQANEFIEADDLFISAKMFAAAIEKLAAILG